MTFGNQKILLGLPPEGINTENIFGRTSHIGADKADPLLLIVPVADIYEFCRDGVSILVRYLYINSQKVF